MIKEYDILEEIHQQKAIAITKGYVTSSLVLMIDESAWYLIKKNPDYHKCVVGDEILEMEWALVIEKKTHFSPYFAEVVVKIGAAQHVERHDLTHEEPNE